MGSVLGIFDQNPNNQNSWVGEDSYTRQQGGTLKRQGEFRTPEGVFHYLDWGGRGPLTHLSHATGFCAGLYTPFAQRLRTRLHVLGMDDRGHGKTRVPADPRRLKDWDIFVTDLERFFEHLGEPVVAMGHSRGAVASMLLTIKRPELVKALILIDPTILPFSWMWWWYLAKKLGLSRYVPIAHRAAKRQSTWPNRETILSVYRTKASFSAWQEGFLESYISWGTEETADGAVKLCCEPTWESRCFAVCPHNVWRHIPRLNKPTLVLYGLKSDTFLKPAAKRFKANVPEAAMVGFEDTGHFVPMERPDECAQAIFEFLQTQGVIRPA